MANTTSSIPKLEQAPSTIVPDLLEIPPMTEQEFEELCKDLNQNQIFPTENGTIDGLTGFQNDSSDMEMASFDFDNGELDGNFEYDNAGGQRASPALAALPGTSNDIPWTHEAANQDGSDMTVHPHQLYQQPADNYASQYPQPDAQDSTPYYSQGLTGVPTGVPMDVFPGPSMTNVQQPMALMPSAPHLSRPAAAVPSKAASDFESDADSDSDASDSSSAGKRRRRKAAKNPVKYKAEKPKKDAKHAWVRTNTTTRGLTTRTGKINQYDPSKIYEEVPPTLNWETSKYSFEYTDAGELVDGSFSAAQIRDYLFEWSKHNEGYGAKLILWIQRCPTDSARRYASEGGSKCRFKHCPATNNTIMHGHYRVAFDEKWATYKVRADPFIQAGYVHLYCLERFLDFREICAKLDVRADDRNKMTKEPRGHWAPALGTHDAEVARKFIKYCKKGTLREHKEYAEYPAHDPSARGAPKEHAFSLTCRMTEQRNGLRPESQQEQFRGRGKSATHITQHKGNLQQIADAKTLKAGTKRKAIEDAAEDVTEVEVETEATRAPPPKKIALKAPPSARRRTRKQKSPTPDDSESEMDTEEDYHPPETTHHIEPPAAKPLLVAMSLEQAHLLGEVLAIPFCQRIAQGEQPPQEEYPEMSTLVQAGFIHALQYACNAHALAAGIQTPEAFMRVTAVSQAPIAAEIVETVETSPQLEPLPMPSSAASETMFLSGSPIDGESLFVTP